MSRLAWLTSVSACLAFVMTSLTLASRLSLLWLLRLYKYEQIHPATWYAVVLMLLVTPHLTQLIYIVWDTPILSSANRQKFPFCWNIALGILSSILEGAATAVFAAEVTPVLPEPVLLTIPYAVLAFSVISNAFVTGEMSKDAPDDKSPSCWSSILLRLGLGIYLFFAPLVTGILLHTGSHFRVGLPELCGLVISLLLLAGVWNPVIQKAIVKSKLSKEKCPMVELIYTPIKLMASSTTVFLCLYCKFEGMRDNATQFIGSVSDELKNVYIIIPVSLCLVAGFLHVMTALVSSKLGLVAAGMKVPFFVCPFLVIVCSVAVWHDFQTDAFWELTGDDLASWSTIVLSITIWIIPFFFTILKFMKSPRTNGRTLSESFISFTWNIFLLEPRTVLNYVSGSFKSSDYNGEETNERIKKEVSMPKSKINTIFLCTTMFKENQREMERYVKSIKDTFDNLKDPSLNIEAHVLFDSAVEDGKLNVKARQLIHLICDTFKLKCQELTQRVTPYGLQMHTGNHLQHAIFIHFKDGLLVKNKKRWSQVMYLNYILQFRCGKINVSEKNNVDRMNSFKTPRSDSFDKEINGYRFIENENFEKMDNIVMDITDGIDTTICSSDIDMFHMQAEYARIRRRISEHSETSVCLPNSSSILPVKEKKDAESQSANYGLRSMEDRLIKTNNGRIHHERKSSNLTDANDGWNVNDSALTKNINHNMHNSLKKMPTIYDWMCHNNLDYTPEASLDQVYVLATDADTAFNAKSVKEVFTQCQSNPDLGAVCGRTEPIGSPKPIVWYQKFEYAKDFWLVKAAQNVIGSVTCCPGCFSIYRGSALVDVYREFSQPTTSGFDSLVKDHGEDRWLCTLLMQKGWRLAYTAHAQNSTHCPETVGEFLRQRRRWVLSEVSNMLSIFINVPKLVQNNSSFSGMFMISLFMTFLWIILSPSTTLVFLCAGGDVLFSVPLTFTLPFAAMLFLVYIAVCCFLSQTRQKLASILITVSMATVVLVLSGGFVVYVVKAVQKDMDTLGSVQFRPYFLVFLLILATIYAAVLHPRESLSLVYGLSYALLFPAIFVVLPVYSLTNMVDQSWGTREPGSHSCCQKIEEEVDEKAFEDFQIDAKHIPHLGHNQLTSEENHFWESLKNKIIGHDVNIGTSAADVSTGLAKLRRTSVVLLLITNCVWFVFLSILYVYAGSDAICYIVASVFSFSLVLQLVGLTCYRINSLIERYLQAHNVKKLNFDLKP